MALPWLRVLDMVVDLANLAIGARGRRAPETASASHLEEPGGRQLEKGLANVVVAALKEAFDRDARRIEFEREQMERERERAERALALELRRQAGEREIGRQRLIGGVSLAGLAIVLAIVLRLGAGHVAARVVLAGGWLLLLASLALSFAAQSAKSRSLEHAEHSFATSDDGLLGSLAVWMLMLGLGATGVGALLA